MLTYDAPAYMFKKTNQVGKQEVGILWIQKSLP
jgi:hypothetical protein